MTTAQRIMAESKLRKDAAIQNKGREPWMMQSEESRIIASVVQDVRHQRNIIAQGGVAPAV